MTSLDWSWPECDLKSCQWGKKDLEAKGSRERKCLQEIVNAVDEDADGAGDGGHDDDAGAHHPDHLAVTGLRGGQGEGRRGSGTGVRCTARSS